MRSLLTTEGLDGDVISGLLDDADEFVEIVNTDAEGRLVLADALHYATKTFAPDAMIDVATLTGAAMMAFGPWATAGLGNDDDLLTELRVAGKQTGETVWPMPLLEVHEKAMRSKVADWKNSGGRDGGSRRRRGRSCRLRPRSGSCRYF